MAEQSVFKKLVQFKKGADIASANDITWLLDGNYRRITGNVQINTISTTGLQDGTVIRIQYTGNPTIKHNQAAGAGFAGINLLGSVDWDSLGSLGIQELTLNNGFWWETWRAPQGDAFPLTAINSLNSTEATHANDVDTDNLDITFSGSVLSATGKGGTALSSTNKFTALLPATTAGQRVSLTITANQTLNDSTHGTPQILGRWGTTASVAWGSDMPFFIGIVNKDDTAGNARFFLTRDPHMTRTPFNVNNIGIGGTAPVTSSQGSIVLFGTAANAGYDQKPCKIIGSLRMQCDNSAGGSWAVSALTAGQDGIGAFQEGKSFTMPAGQNGNASGAYMADNGGTAPVFTTNNFKYEIEKSGLVTVYLHLTGDGGADGAGAVNSIANLPYTSSFGIGFDILLGAAALEAAGAVLSNGAALLISNSSNLTFLKSDGTNLQNADFANGSRYIKATVKYHAF